MAEMESHDSEKHFEQLLARGLLDLEAAGEFLAQQEQICQGNFDERWIFLKQLLSARKEIDQALLHADPFVRAVALILLKNYWPVIPDTGKTAQHFFLYDPDPRVRGVAAMTVFRAQDFVDAHTKRLCTTIMQHSHETPIIPKPKNCPTFSKSDFRKKDFDHKRHLWELLAGDSLPILLNNREATEKALQDANPKMRMAGMCLLCDHWPHRPNLRRQLENLAAEDSDVQVRSMALVCLGTIHRGTNDTKLGIRFAEIVRDEHQSTRLRRSAYSGLINLRALPLLSPVVMLFNENLSNEFPVGCDWEFVESFLKNK